jgi:hypothetical protein
VSTKRSKIPHLISNEEEEYVLCTDLEFVAEIDDMLIVRRGDEELRFLVVEVIITRSINTEVVHIKTTQP